MISTIEDLIAFICDPINEINWTNVVSKDKAVLYSFNSQMRKSLAFTEKQAELAIKILDRNRSSFQEIKNFNELLSVPSYKHPFRIVDTSKIVSIVQLDSSDFISIKFPYNPKIDSALSSTRKLYNKKTKSFLLELSEANILRVVDVLRDFDFDISNELISYYDQIKEIKNNPENYLPLADFEDRVVLRNSNKKIVSYFDSCSNNQVIHDAVLCKSMGLLFSHTLEEHLKNLKIDPLTKALLNSKQRRFEVKNYNNIDISKSLQAIDQWPVLVIMNDDDESQVTLSQWIHSLTSIGVAQEEMSVLFRSNTNKSFNDFVRDHCLNNLVTEKTKVVFIKQKMPKILQRMDFYPKIIISLCAFYAHFTNQKLVDYHPLVLYYATVLSNGKKIATL